MTGYLVCFIFVFTCLLAFIEDYLGKLKLPLYIGLGISLILIAGFREVGIDPDSANYELSFRGVATGNPDALVEYSYILLSEIALFFSSDVHLLFLIYAIFGVSLKFIAFRQLCDSWFLPVIAYISYFYIFNECMQIRAGVMAGFMLLAIKPWSEGRLLRAFLLIFLGFLFHYSAIMLLPLLFLSNKEFTLKSRIIWTMIIPFGYILYFYGFSFLLNVSVDIPYIGDKLAMYQYGVEKGLSELFVNVFSPLFLFTAFLYFYLLYFYDTIVKENRYFPLMIKILGVGIFSYCAFGSFPPLAQRINLLLRVVSIILYANVCYTILPKWAGTCIVILISFVYLNYAVPSISFHLFWDPGKFF